MSADTLTQHPIDTIFSVPLQPVAQIQEPIFKPFLDFSEPVDTIVFERISMFNGHLLKPVHSESLLVPDLFNGWFFALLLCGFVLYAWLLSFNMKRVIQMSGALWRNHGFNRLQRNGDIFSEQIFFPLVVLMLLGLSLFAFRTGILLGLWDMSGVETLTIYGQVILGIGLLYLCKMAIIKIHAWIYKEQVAAKQYLLNLFVFNTCLALLFLPFFLVAFFGDSRLQTSVIYIMIFLFAIWYIWRGVRSFLVILPVTKFSYVHNFLYFCTLEIGYYLLVYVVSARFLTL